MKKIFFTAACVFFTMTGVFAADQVKVSALEEFNTATPAKDINVRVERSSEIGSYSLEEGDILHCEILNIKNPKRAKINADFTVKPISYTRGEEEFFIKENYIGDYSAKVLSKEELEKVDKGQLAKKAIVTVGNHFVKGISPVVTVAEGMVKNENGNRLKSGAVKLYKSSPLSYVEKGTDLDIKTGDSFYFVFKNSKSKDEDKQTEETEIEEENI